MALPRINDIINLNPSPSPLPLPPSTWAAPRWMILKSQGLICWWPAFPANPSPPWATSRPSMMIAGCCFAKSCGFWRLQRRLELRWLPDLSQCHVIGNVGEYAIHRVSGYKVASKSPHWPPVVRRSILGGHCVGGFHPSLRSYHVKHRTIWWPWSFASGKSFCSPNWGGWNGGWNTLKVTNWVTNWLKPSELPMWVNHFKW